jgi:hypothetical protein
MFIAPKNTDLLLSEAEKEYLKLVEQINKDFNLANEAIVSNEYSPNELKFSYMKKSID